MTAAIVCAAVQSDCRAVALLDSYWLLSCDADPVIEALGIVTNLA